MLRASGVATHRRASAAIWHKTNRENESAAAHQSCTEDRTNWQAGIAEISVMRACKAGLIKDGCRDRDSVHAAPDGSLPFKTQK